MEPEIKQLIQRVLNTLFFGLIWAVSNTTLGLMNGLAYIGSSLTVWNVLFYIWLIASSGVYIFYLIHLWKQPLNNQ